MGNWYSFADAYPAQRFRVEVGRQRIYERLGKWIFRVQLQGLALQEL